MAAGARSSIGTVYIQAKISAKGSVSELSKELDKSLGGIGKSVNKSISGTTDSLKKVVSDLNNSTVSIKPSVADNLKTPLKNSAMPKVANLPKIPMQKVNLDWRGAAKNGARAIGSALESAGTRFNRSLKRVTLGTVGTIAGAATAAFGVAMKKGWDRAVSIDAAKAKLGGLGHDAESVKQIMDDALESVSGTAYGLADAVTVSATAVAAGLKPGKELAGYLSLIADGATIAGVPLNEMGAILNKVKIGGKLFSQELNQLQDRGLPITTWLMEELGVSAEELRGKMKKGLITFEDLSTVLEKNLGGAAKNSGNTIQGSIDNVGAAMGRFGATVWGSSGLLELIKPFNNELMAFWDTLSKKVGPVLEKLAFKYVPILGEKIEGAGEKFANFLTGFADHESVLSKIKKSYEEEWKSPLAEMWEAGKDVFIGYLDVLRNLKPVFDELGRIVRENPETVGKMVAWGIVLNGAFGMIGSVFKVLKPVAGAIGKLVKPMKSLMDLVKKGGGLKAVFGPNGLAKWFGRIGTKAIGLAGPIGLAVSALFLLWDVISNWDSISKWFGDVWDFLNPAHWGDPTKGITEWLKNVPATIQNIFGESGKYIAALMGPIGLVASGFMLINDFANNDWKAPEWLSSIGNFFNPKNWGDPEKGIMSWLGPVGKAIGDFFGGIGSKLGEFFKPVGDVLASIGGALGVVFEPLWGILTSLFEIVTKIFGMMFTLVSSVLGPIINFIKNIFTTIGSWIGSLFMNVANGVWQFFSPMFEPLVAIWNSVLEWFNTTIGVALGAITTNVTTSISGAISGISSFFGNIGSNIGTAWQAIGGFFSTVGGHLQAFSGSLDAVGTAVSNIGTGVANFLTTMVNGFTGFINTLTSGINVAINGINGIGFTMPSWLGGHDFRPNIPLIPAIPSLATGGLVTGPTVAMVGDTPNGEYVVDRGVLDSYLRATTNKIDAGGEMTPSQPIVKNEFNITQSDGENGEDFARRVAEMVANYSDWDSSRRD